MIGSDYDDDLELVDERALPTDQNERDLPPGLFPDDNEDTGEQRGGDTGDADQETDGRKENEKKPKRVIVRKPQPKLDPERLKGERGLGELRNMFEHVRFKGKGYEVEDLNLLLSKMEYWGHRLFPKMPFDELIERLEALGHKKVVQNCLARMRLGLPVTDADYEAYLEQQNEEDEPRPDNPQNEEEMGGQGTDDEEMEAEVEGEPLIPAPSSAPSQLSDDVMERIRQNRERALAKRRATTAGDSHTTAATSASASDNRARSTVLTTSETVHDITDTGPTHSETELGITDTRPTISETEHGITDTRPTISETEHGITIR